MSNWNDLSLKEKAAMMQVAVDNGIYKLSDIRKAYNEFAEGGPEEILNKVNSSDANFVQRLKDPNRKYIQDWGSDKIATHKLSVGTDEYGNNYIYPEVQEINGKLVDFTRPPYTWWAGMESAEQRGDTVRIQDLEDAIKFTEEYKKYYPKGKTFAEGGPENDGTPRPITTGGAGYVPSSSSNVQVFNKEKIYNRVLPTEMTGANTGPLDSVKQYLFNNDRAVDEWFENYVPYINNSYGDAIEASRIINDLYSNADTEKEQEFLENSSTWKSLRNKKLAPEMFVQEDGKDTYLGMPQRFGTIRDAEYQPANGKLVNGKYVSYMRDPTFVDTEIIPTYQNYITGITREDNPESNVQRVTKNGNALVSMPFLNNATMSKGYDPNRGEYISIYDDWDYNTAVLGKSGDNISKFIGGQPFSIYDRYYLDDIYDVPKDKRGSYYLPEVTVTPDKKSLGGPLVQLANEYSKGGRIYIKPSHRGKFTRLKERTGHSASWFKENGTPAQKKMATFELNARHWHKHALGGYLEGNVYDLPENEVKRLIDLGYEIEYL